jgi:hypothetical protein
MLRSTVRVAPGRRTPADRARRRSRADDRRARPLARSRTNARVSREAGRRRWQRCLDPDRSGRNVGASFGERFPPLPLSVFGRVISDQTRTTSPVKIAPSLLFSTRNERPQQDSKAKFRDVPSEIAVNRRSGVRASPSGRAASPRSHVLQPDRPGTTCEHHRPPRLPGCALG